MNALITIAVIAAVVAAPMRANVVPSDAVVYVDAEQRASADDALYEQGSDLLDEHEWRAALDAFARVERLHSAHADAALYWQAYAMNKLALRADALAKIAQLQRVYPKSRWVEDAEALEVEIRHSLGEVVRPDSISDDDVKLMAISGMIDGDPEHALPILEGIVAGNKPPKVKERALFVIAQSGAPQARRILVRVAEDDRNGELQENAIRMLAVFGGGVDREVLAKVYDRTKSADVKRSVIRSYMLSGDRARLLALAKSERNDDLRGDAVLQLGLAGGTKELADIYARERSGVVRLHILDALFVSNNADRIADIAKTESNPDLRNAAIRDLGLLGGPRTGQLLVGFYDERASRDLRLQVIEALFIRQDAAALRTIAQREKDDALKRDIEQKLALMH